MRFSLDQYGHRVYIDEANRNETYYCPECAEKMVQRHGEIMTHCFAHYPNTQCTDAWHYDESDWHIKFQSLFPLDNQEVVLEHEGTKHRADVCYPERKVVIEIQGERIRQTEFEARNDYFRKLGYHIIWIFDESRVFENESINYGYRRMACTRFWEHPSKTFEGFCAQKVDDVEVWFMRSESDYDDQPRLFRIISNSFDFKTMDCSFCHSLKELMRYLKEGRKTPDYGSIFDVKYRIKRTDGSYSYYYCPKQPGTPFITPGTCDNCLYHTHPEEQLRANAIGCSYRIEHMNWNIRGEVQSFTKRTDGFVESIILADENGEVNVVKLDNPKTYLRSTIELWERYKPVKHLICYDVKHNELFKIFNPAWQKNKYGVIKAAEVSYKGRPIGGEEPIDYAEDPVWIVVDYTKSDFKPRN